MTFYSLHYYLTRGLLAEEINWPCSLAEYIVHGVTPVEDIEHEIRLLDII